MEIKFLNHSLFLPFSFEEVSLGKYGSGFNPKFQIDLREMFKGPTFWVSLFIYVYEIWFERLLLINFEQ